MSDKELEEKLRWIFEAYGKDLHAFFRDAYANGLNVRPASPQFSQYCIKCGEGHNKMVSTCLHPDCGGRMVDRKQAMPAALKLEPKFKGVRMQFDNLTRLKWEEGKDDLLDPYKS